MPNKNFFKKTTISEKVKAGGPSAEDQLLAMANNKYWTVLGSSSLSACGKDNNLINRANAFKSALQTYGPTSDQLPDFRHNEGKAKNSVFHGHVTGSSGTSYILEWAVIDSGRRIMALVGFDTHENYSFKQKPLTADEQKKILAQPESKKILENVAKKVQEAKDKVERVELNYRNK